MIKALRIGIIAGEKSGDNLGAALISAIRQQHPQVSFEGIGGEAMLAAGFHSFFPMERLSVMGFVEPLARLPELLRMEKFMREHFLADPPDVFIGIDSPGFNLRIEESLRKSGIRTVHYVSPSVWAYREKRIHRIKRAVDLMLVLFPFEKSIYETHGIGVEFVGHPLADQIGFEDRQASARARLGIDPLSTVITLMPGSRGSELKRLGPVFLRTARRCLEQRPQLEFLLPCAGAERLAQMQDLVKR
ncbi:MAG: lipid-A-disaccharide synthase, partial [Pseudohongiellaceae bacterium]